jgi:hypothetical protein
MREIKFRAKRKFDGTIDLEPWVYSSNMRLDAKTNRLNLGGLDCDLETLGQFTGMTDKTGKEIYEGDIVAELDVGDEVWDAELKSLIKKCPVGEIVYTAPTFNIKRGEKGEVENITTGAISEINMSHYDGLYMWHKDEETLRVIGNKHDGR